MKTLINDALERHKKRLADPELLRRVIREKEAEFNKQTRLDKTCREWWDKANWI